MSPSRQTHGADAAPPASAPRTTPWETVRVRWPYEKVTVALEVVVTRDLTTLEWVLERILDEFGEQSPSLTEAAEELGLGEPVFLQSTLQSLLALHAVAPRTTSAGTGEAPDPERLDLSDVGLTDSGRELYRLGKIDGAPSHPRTSLFFDVLTDRHVPSPPKAGTLAADDAIELYTSDTWPEPRSLSLDQVRACSLERGERHQKAPSRISRFERDESSFEEVFEEIIEEVTLSIQAKDGRGVLKLGGPSLRPEQLAWLETCAERLLPDDADRGHPFCAVEDQVIDAAALCRRAVRLVGTRALPERLSKLVQGARWELVLHAALLDGDSASSQPLLDPVRERARAGLRCIVRGGTHTALDVWTERGDEPPGFLLFVAAGGPLPVAAVADGTTGLLAQRASLTLPSGQPAVVGMVAEVEAGPAAELVARLHEGLADTLARQAALAGSPELDVAALLLGADDVAERVLSRIRAEQHPPERAQALVRLSRWLGGTGRPGTGAATDWAGHARRALEEALTAQPLDEGPSGGPAVARLLGLSVGLLDRAVVFERLVDKLVPQPVVLGRQALERYAEMLAACERLGTGPAPVASATTRRFVEDCLEIPSEPPPVPPETARLVERLAGRERARRWAAQISGLWPEPDGLPQLEVWLKQHAPLSRLLSEAFVGTALRCLQRLAPQGRDGLDADARQRLVSAWTGCALPRGEAEKRLAPPPAPASATAGRRDAPKAPARGTKKSKR